MFHLLPARWLASLTLITALGASAQAVRAPAPVASAPAEKAGAGPGYRSALETYQPFNEEKVRSWTESNDTVGRIGGWRAYAREVQGEDARPTSQPAAADPHAGHGGKPK